MQGDVKVVEFLNKALRHELTAVNQYWLHYRLLDNWGYKRLGHHLYEESIDEMKDADKLIQRITRGHWSIEPWKGGSLVAYVLWTDPGGVIPMWAVNRASRRTLPEVVVALRDRVRGAASSQASGTDGG